MGPLVFLLFAALVVAAALTVVLHPNPVKSAMALVATLFLLAIAFVTLEAHMVAALQIIVYAGAIMVLFLFVIMLLDLRDDVGEAPVPGRAVLRGAAWVAGALFAILMAGVVSHTALGPPAPATDGYGGALAVARSLFGEFLLPFELTGILLLVAVIGPVVLARRGDR